VAVMLYRPAGLWPEARRRRELMGQPPDPLPVEGGDGGSPPSDDSGSDAAPPWGGPAAGHVGK
jgi:hypothetical protein